MAVIARSASDANRHCEPTGRANARPMTGSAKQSTARATVTMDCFVASLLAMTVFDPTPLAKLSASRDLRRALSRGAVAVAFADSRDRWVSVPALAGTTRGRVHG